MMNRKFINIVISGAAGTGKTSIATQLAHDLYWKHVSAGDFFREFHQLHHIPLTDPFKVPTNVEHGFDHAFQQKIADTQDCVFEGHYQGWNTRMLPHTYRVLIVADAEIILQRVKLYRKEESVTDFLARKAAVEEHFHLLYGEADYLAPSLFHLVLDNSHGSIAEHAASIKASFVTANQ